MSNADTNSTQSDEEIGFRLAGEADFPHVAALLDTANEGAVSKIWGDLALEGETWLDVAWRLMKEPGTDLYYRNSLIATVNGEVAGMMSFSVNPPEFCEYDESTLNALERPFIVMQRRAPGYVFVRDIAIYPQYRRRGLQTHLFKIAIATARQNGLPGLASTVHANNDPAIALHYSFGFTEQDEHIILEHPTYPAGSYLKLLTLTFDKEGTERGGA